MSTERRGWRRSPISPLAHAIRMDAVRQANIFPTCRLDKSSRAVYGPEDVWAKRAALVKPESRSSTSSSRARAMLKQKVMTMSTTGVTKENMEAVDRVKEVVAVLMKQKERAADIGTAERRVLQPQVARRMSRMSAERKADFDRRVHREVERIVHSAKRRYVRRQEHLDETGVFHPEANAHRVHTQFWADLNNTVDITKIENAVWAKMSAEASDANTTATVPKAASAVARGTPAVASRTLNDSDSARPSSKESSRHEAATGSKGSMAEDEALVGSPSRSANDGNRPNKKQGRGGKENNPGHGKEARTDAFRREGKEGRAGPEENQSHAEAGEADVAPTVGESRLPAPSTDKFAGIPGYDEVGHVPTLDEFRLEWPKAKFRRDLAFRQEKNVAGGAKGRRKQQIPVVKAQNNTGSVVNDLSKRDEVFRHFKRYYDKVDHSGVRTGDALFSAGVATTGLLQPDFEVIEAVGQHTAEAQESRGHSRVGEGLLSTSARVEAPRRSSRDRGTPPAEGSGGPESRGGGEDGEERGGSTGLTNIFRDSMQGSEGVARRAAQGAFNVFANRSENDADAAAKDALGNLEEGSIGDRFSGSLSSSDGRSGRSGRSGKSGRSGVRNPQYVGFKWSAGCQRAKSSLEGSSSSAELQARLEASWRALLVPARLKLDFLQKYSTLERALELPRAAQLLEIAGKTLPLREKVISHLHRMEHDGEPMFARSVFSASDEEALYDLDCWVDFGTVSEHVPNEDPANNACGGEEQDGIGSGGGYGSGSSGREVDGGTGAEDDEEGYAAEGRGGSQHGRLIKEAWRRQEAEAVLAWLREIDSRLVETCAEVCDAAWYDLGETITYKGRPVVDALPPSAMETAMQRREQREDNDERGGRRAR